MLNKYLKIEKYNQPPLLSTSTVERAGSIKPLKEFRWRQLIRQISYSDLIVVIAC